jgi:hypothetical protein
MENKYTKKGGLGFVLNRKINIRWLVVDDTINRAERGQLSLLMVTIINLMITI